jgi:hypothetical protein
MSILCILTLMWSVTFSLSHSCVILSQVGQHEVPVTYLGSRVAKWQLLGKANANEGSSVCSLLSLGSYPKRAHSTSLTLPAKYWGARWRMPLSKPITIT